MPLVFVITTPVIPTITMFSMLISMAAGHTAQTSASLVVTPVTYTAPIVEASIRRQQSKEPELEDNSAHQCTSMV